MATDPGTDEYRDRPGHCPRHSRPVLRSRAAGVRMGVGCGSSEELTPTLDRPAGPPEIAFATAAVTPRPRSQRPHRSRAGGVLSLDSESLMGVRPGQGYFDDGPFLSSLVSR